MILDQFDQDVLSASGRAEDLILEMYGRKISQNSAKKYMAAIRMHVNTKAKMPEPDGRSGMSEVVTKYDGTKTIKRMMVLSESDANDPIRVMQLNGLDPLKWELVKYGIRRNDWDVTMKMKRFDRDAGVLETWKEKETNHLFAVDLTVKPLQSVLSTDYVMQVFEELEAPEIKPVKYKPGNVMFELPIMDFHFNKLPWDIDQDGVNVLDAEEKQYRETIKDLVGKLKLCNLKVEKTIYPVGQDFFHVDTSDKTTTAGTHVDAATHWERMYRIGCELLVWTVELLREFAPVEIMYVPGNHDKVLSYCATYNLYSMYKDCKGVTVNLSPNSRKYVHYGVNLIGYSHGKEEGKRIEHLMQQEQPEAWGQSMFREWHLGDLHHEEAKEIGGLKIRRMSSVAAQDAWHNTKGYQSIRMAQAFVWDREKGRQFVFDSNVIGK